MNGIFFLIVFPYYKYHGIKDQKLISINFHYHKILLYPKWIKFHPFIEIILIVLFNMNIEILIKKY